MFLQQFATTFAADICVNGILQETPLTCYMLMDLLQQN